jgi:hypothetical protein
MCSHPLGFSFFLASTGARLPVFEARSPDPISTMTTQSRNPAQQRPSTGILPTRDSQNPLCRMLNGFLTFYYGALNFSCYYGDSAPGGELLGLLLVKRTHGSYVDLAARGHRGAGHGGEPGPSVVPVGSYPYRRRARLASKVDLLRTRNLLVTPL